MERLYGTGVALVTPFRDDKTVDVDALKRIVKYCKEGGVDYLVVLGTTGEAVTLEKSEKQVVIKTIVEENAGDLPLVIGIGGNNTLQIADELKHADLNDFDAILSVSPYYNKPTQEGIYLHYKELARVAPKPLILYNVPGRTGSNMLPETVARLARDCDNIIAIKEASGDMEQVKQLLKDCPDNFYIISGDDFTALPTVTEGGIGVISVLGQGLPVDFSKMIRLGLNGEHEGAYELHESLLPGMKLIFEEGNPAGIKAILENLGLCNALVRLPLVEASEGLKARLANFVKAFAIPI